MAGAVDNRKRGPYKSYVADGQAKIPRTTLWRKRKEESKTMDTMLNDGDNEEDLVNDIRDDTDEEKSIGDDGNCDNGAFGTLEEDLSNENIYYDDEANEVESDEKNNSSIDDDYVDAEDGYAEDDNGGIDDNSDASNNASWDLPLYLNASVTLAQCILLIMAFALSQKLSQESLQHLLKLLTLLLPAGHILPRTKHLFNKFFSKRDTILCVYCSHCHSPIGEKEANECSSCHHPFHRKQLLNAGNFFIYMPVESQLREILEMHELQFDMHSNDDSLSDISDGRNYREFLQKQEKSDGRFISLTLNSDGVPVFKSSLYSLWPMLCSINELSPDQRKKQILMPGLWFGSIKPIFSTFFEPFIAEINKLREHGFNFVNHQGMVCKFYVTVLLVTCDSVARCMFQNVKQYNGSFGCGWCMQEGVNVEKGRGHSRVYPFDDSIEKRCHNGHIIHARAALKNKSPVFGVKGPSPLLCLPDLDVINGFVVDYMHCIDLGVTRYMAALWFDSHNHNEPWYVGSDLDKINIRLNNIKPPNTITRLPRSLASRKFWKASEWRAFLLFYSFYALNGILPTKYLTHIMLLSQSLFLLLQDKITQDDLCQAELCIRLFVQNFETLYGRRYMTYNLHILSHMTDSVRNWGPLWCYSNYTFENVNGILLNMFHGTQAVGKQITRTFLLFRNIKSLASARCHAMSPIVNVCLNNFLYKNRRLQRAVTVDQNITFMGKPIVRQLTVLELLATERLLGCELNGIEGRFYSKAIIDGQFYHSLSYQPKRNMRRNNYTVLLDNGELVQLCNFLLLNTGTTDLFVCFCNVYLTTSVSVTGENFQPQCAFNDRIRFITGISQSYTAVNLSRLKQKCILISDNYESIICILPNGVNDMD